MNKSAIALKIEENRYSSNVIWRILAKEKDQASNLAFDVGKKISKTPESNWFIDIAKERGISIPGVFVETGTYRGDSTFRLARFFEQIHTIELSQLWYERAVDRFANYPNITCHHGDSSLVLPKVLSEIHEPALIFLDAHYAGGTTAHGDAEVPLLSELETIGKRPYQDLVVIDDFHLVGKSGQLGTDGHFYYSTMDYDWRDITNNGIRRALGKNIGGWDVEDNRLILYNFQ